MPVPRLDLRPSRRAVLGAGVAGAAALAAGRPLDLVEALAACPPSGQSLRDVQHIVILVQENRSFDHYFGTYKGVRGYADRSVPGGAGAFAQAFAAAGGLTSPQLPWHIDTAVAVPPQQGDCTNDIEHQWAGQHDSWNGGANDRWMRSHVLTEPDQRQAAVTMGYYTRADLPFYYALADHFTLCDAYHCSVLAGTDVNRLYSITGTIDPDGFDGGCQFLSTKTGTIQNPGADLGSGGRWVPYPQVLQQAGITWKVYGTADGQAGDNVLRYFPQFRPVGGTPALAANAFGSQALADFAADCAAGRLPQVSWVLTGLADTEHAPDPITWGESVTHTLLAALMTSGAWASTVCFITYDENGGFFDHVAPLTPPAGTPGEFLNQAALTAGARAEATTVDGRDLSSGPIGLGFRVPALVVSPFARNPTPGGSPLVCSDRFDHTSLLRFIETWSAAAGNPAPIPARDAATRTPGLSAWRRAAVGDLTSALSLGRAADASLPTDLLTMVPNRADPRVLSECITTGTLGSLASQTAPVVQDPPVVAGAIPLQESTPSVQRPTVAAATTCTAPASTPTPAAGSALPVAAATTASPNTAGGAGGGAGAALSLLAVGLVGVAGWRRRRIEERRPATGAPDDAGGDGGSPTPGRRFPVAPGGGAQRDDGPPGGR